MSQGGNMWCISVTNIYRDIAIEAVMNSICMSQACFPKLLVDQTSWRLAQLDYLWVKRSWECLSMSKTHLNYSSPLCLKVVPDVLKTGI